MNLAIRWTIGDVSSRGFEALALSIEGAHGVFGSSATYVVCVNTVDVATARHRTGPIPAHVDWHDCTHDRPKWLADYVDAGMAEGVAWKFAPVQLFRDRHTLSLDNGPSKDFKTHLAWLPTGRWGLENVANLDKVPAAGATLVVGLAKVKDATGGPARLIALV